MSNLQKTNPKQNPKLLESNKKQFLINSNLLIFQNRLFLQFYKFSNQNQKLSKNNNTFRKKYSKFKKEELEKIEEIGEEQENRKDDIRGLADNKKVSVGSSIKLIDNKTNKIIEMNNYDVVNRFKKKLLDNRFISQVLIKENWKDSIFITLTTESKYSINEEIGELEEKSKKIEEKLKKNKIKFIKIYELTKKDIPHVHILALSSSKNIKKEIEKIADSSKNYLIQKVDKKDLPKVANYITKVVKEKDKSLMLGFERVLKSNGIKMFTSSKSKYFTKNNRSILFNAFLIHIKYMKIEKNSFLSEEFIRFCFEYVKIPLKLMNVGLKSDKPHFVLEEDKVYHSSNLRVFNRYTRVDEDEKREIKKTNEFIVYFSKILLGSSDKQNNRYVYKVDLISSYYIVIYIMKNMFKIINEPP